MGRVSGHRIPRSVGTEIKGLSEDTTERLSDTPIVGLKLPSMGVPQLQDAMLHGYPDQ